MGGGCPGPCRAVSQVEMGVFLRQIDKGSHGVDSGTKPSSRRERMDAHQLEQRIRSILGKILEMDLRSADPDAHIMEDLGADSWQYLEFRNDLETAFRVTVPDSEVDRLSTLRSCAGLVSELLAPQSGAGRAEDASQDRQEKRNWKGGTCVGADGALYTDLEIGMAMTGRNHLAESPLMKFVGELRWNHISEFTGIPSRKLCDETGERLYATFFYVETRFPRETPLAAFGENDRFTVVSTLKSFGNSILDGYHFFYPAGWPEDRKVPLLNGRQALDLGIPYVRTSNIFVKMLQGASWLKKSRPAQKGMDDIPRLAEIPDSYGKIKQADADDRFRPPPEGYTCLTPEPAKIEYAIEPDRDLNGVGLLYFANYPMILDIAERRCLRDKTLLPFPEEMIDLRTLSNRESAYLGNAHQSDSIEVWIDVWMENPFLLGHPAPEMSPVRMFFNYRMFRRSDGRKILVSTAEKIVFGKTLEEAGLLDPLEMLAATARFSG